MELDIKSEGGMMTKQDVPLASKEIDPVKGCFPCCIVWTPLPVISWFLPLGKHNILIRSCLSFMFFFLIGIIFGGVTFLTFLTFFAFLLVGWFLCGTNCFKNFIQI
uniref:LOW QUALITY PROTEIN: protein RTE1-HOMOLOG n=1 Tax=Erigeron canadensis TaxID=72917 RepID=UPI001CB8B53F|nr:LOW QUALITY PROTEIN: protein RTE1-HOMOLOG [Erigeron canadensis]